MAMLNLAAQRHTTATMVGGRAELESDQTTMGPTILTNTGNETGETSQSKHVSHEKGSSSTDESGGHLEGLGVNVLALSESVLVPGRGMNFVGAVFRGTLESLPSATTSTTSITSSNIATSMAILHIVPLWPRLKDI